jgi:hypothetical protein
MGIRKDRCHPFFGRRTAKEPRMSTQSVIETLVERAKKFNILIRNEERSTLPGTQNLLVSCLKDMRPLGLCQATIKELPPATSPKLICARMFNHTSGRIG